MATQMVSNGEVAHKVKVVLGAQWGDEGKGKLVDLLAEHADVVARCQVRDSILTFLRENLADIGMSLFLLFNLFFIKYSKEKLKSELNFLGKLRK